MVTRRLQAGFTAAEILVVVAIIGILAAIAAPSMQGLLTTQAIRSSAYDLYADLIYARTEAISRQTNVSITGASTTDFKAGWTITEAAGNTTLRTQAARTGKVVFTGNANVYTFDKTGRLIAPVFSPTDVPRFSIVPYGVSTPLDHQMRCIKLDPSGRPRTNEGVCA